MTFEHYWTLLLKQWKLIIGCFLLAGLGTFGVSKIITPLYQSSVVMEISIHSGNSSSDYNNLLASDQLVQTEAQLATSDTVLREVASHYAGLTSQQLTNDVTSTPKLNTQLFEIDVLDASSTQAAKLANDVATTLIKQQQQLAQQANATAQQQIQQELISTQAQIDATTSKIAALQATGGQDAKVQAAQAKLTGLQQHYTQWQTALAQLELTQAQSADFLHIVQSAQPGLKPVRPNVLLNTAAGFLAGLFLGIVLAILFEQLDVHVHTPEELAQLLNWSVLATIWRSRSSGSDVMINPQGHDPNIEAYRILRTNIGFSSVDKPLHSLMVTSASPGDGKSTTAANLAIFMAKAGKSTLLIDADLRRPTQHQLFQLTAEKQGLSNAILAFGIPIAANSSSNSQFLSPASSLQQSSTSNSAHFSLEPYTHSVSIPNLRVMPSGPLPPNPADLLDSKAMQRLFAALATCGAEIVIVDAPPIRGLSDAGIMASKVDGTLVVVDIARSNKSYLLQTKTLLLQAGAHVIGCVANKQRRSRHDTSSYYYYQYGKQTERDATPQANGRTQAGPYVDSAHVFDAAKGAVKVALGSKEGGHSKNAR